MSNPSPLQVGYDPRSGWWTIAPLIAVGGDLHEVDLTAVRVSSDDAGNVVEIDLAIPGVEDILRLQFIASSVNVEVHNTQDVPVAARGQIAGTDFAAPDWYAIQSLRCDLEIRSQSQYFEWVRRVG